MKKVLLFLMSLVLCVATAAAQGRGVSGTVTDAADHEPLIGATVTVKGASGQGAVTDINGKFTLKGVKAGATLVVSYIGYTTKEVPVGKQTELQLGRQADRCRGGHRPRDQALTEGAEL